MTPRRRAQLFVAVFVPTVFVSVVEFATITLGVAPDPVDPLVIWNPRRDAGLNEEEGEFRYSSTWLWEPRPGVVVRGEAINDDAHRGPPLDPDDKRGIRIAVLGDSSTYGFGLAEGGAWGRVLEKLLRAIDVEVEVINFGVIGFSLEQGYRIYTGKVREYRPDIVVAAFGCVNDHVPDLMTDRQKIDLVSNPLFKLRQFFVRYGSFRLLERIVGGPPKPREVDRSDVTPRVPIHDFKTRLVDLDRAVREDGGRLVIVNPPRTVDGETRMAPTIEYTKAIREVAAAESIPMAPVYDVFRAQVNEKEFFLDAWHPTIKGHRLYAIHVILAIVEQAGFFPELKQRPEYEQFVAAGAAPEGG